MDSKKEKNILKLNYKTTNYQKLKKQQNKKDNKTLKIKKKIKKKINQKNQANKKGKNQRIKS